MFNTDDTIVAVSSAAGAAGRSIVRLSGPRAAALAEGVFSRPLADVGGFRALGGVVKVDKPYLIQAPARLYLFRAPRSYTRQDVVELHVPGEVVASALTAALVEAGARQAEAGEFTARAFFSGRLDLAAAEAVADVIDAEADAQLRLAMGVLEGAVGRLCRPASEALTEALATVEAGIDFADEDIPLASPTELAAAVAKVVADLESAVESAGGDLPAPRLAHVAIAGRPNAGKSSLLNALSGTERVIVSALAGTTRDVLSAPARLPGGAEVILLDAAGLAAGDEAPADPLLHAAGAAARQAVASADAVLFLMDAAAGQPDRERQLLEEVRQLNRRAPLAVLVNKIDLVADRSGLLADLGGLVGQAVLPVSAQTGEGLGELLRLLEDRLAELAAPQTGKLLLRARQKRAIGLTAESARRACQLLRSAGSVADKAELVAIELRAALGHLGEVTGQVVTEDVLAAIFSRFCIGK